MAVIKKYRFIVDLAVGSRLPLRALCLQSDQFCRAILPYVEGDLPTVVGVGEQMEKLNSAVEHEIGIMQKLLLANSVKTIFSTDDYRASGQVLYEAARRAGVNRVALAHGYIQHPTLVSCFPGRSDTFIAWTKQQKEDLERDLGPFKSTDIQYIGFPKIFPQSQMPPAPMTILLCACAMFGQRLDKVRQDLFGTLAANLVRKCDARVFVRLHPKERALDDAAQWLRRHQLTQSGFARLEDDLSRCHLVIGGNSSVLVEAFEYGREAIQVEELARFEFENVHVLRLNSINSEVLERILRSRMNKEISAEMLAAKREIIRSNLREILIKSRPS
ncbi:hypothetical protein SADO_00725 [Salinisphaera dokdonensis CL-ES53]|uniref:Uncharacterized protein n=2 Tax=Salinisphaera TaxID=180541 RepID=A0ABV2AWQ8_9GAMM